MEKPGLLDGAIAPFANDRLFGHGAAEQFLASSYQSGKLHHAILIEGPEGIGKATLAFRFAHHVLSHPDPASAPFVLANPDPNSLVGRQIASGASHNLLHIARPVDEKTGRVKSSITVEEIRKAGHFFSQTSGGGNWRIVILDPADDMNRNAANAILKVLEEPPKRSLFLVLSHAPGKLLPTIRSRCMPLKLQTLGIDDLASALAHLGVSPPVEQMAALSDLSKGSVSQALKLINYGGMEIIAAFNAILASEGPAARRQMHKLADALSAKDSDVIYHFFIEHLSEFLMDNARQVAMAGDLARAERLSRLSSAIVEKLGVAGAYNLDRKQTLLEILGEVAAV
ncbi:DNA polymerase III subunit delta' [Agrobacterium vitis]|uniref:DNA polymerase III subunit delta' n=1 Tax=Agrobacterium vitis TaxID=373 RepID=UPI000873322B|nr:DNA polymerase III subunit delta' [Agrobacterium vitis]MCE6077074.1 DNA polymerase III subunit delta' [Agrobacterium vitis]MCM2469203.1 DNA polymerase III subunit delta' [Agrobacterium vitis]MUO69394.1 DNA polymerase III subunit delta' [Agrobacterium vitis]MUO83874.1 DNA polymerase III subunit delta' [Agrobacterium vitis]MVA36464.1 DNA polymerase III subunit delta' [Agrobacterium vitis]